jgi:hypothetical protein
MAERMKKARILIFSNLLFLILSSSLYAAEVVNEEARINIWYPDNWKMTSDEDTLMLADPDGEAVVMYMLLPTAEMEQAIKEINKDLASIIELTEVGEPKEMEVNGMRSVYLDAQGKIEEVKIGVGIIFIYTPANKLLLVMSMVESGKYEKHEETLAKIIMGIKPR